MRAMRHSHLSNKKHKIDVKKEIYENAKMEHNLSG